MARCRLLRQSLPSSRDVITSVVLVTTFALLESRSVDGKRSCVSDINASNSIQSSWLRHSKKKILNWKTINLKFYLSELGSSASHFFHFLLFVVRLRQLQVRVVACRSELDAGDDEKHEVGTLAKDEADPSVVIRQRDLRNIKKNNQNFFTITII